MPTTAAKSDKTKNKPVKKLIKRKTRKSIFHRNFSGGGYTYNEYMTWNEDSFWELIDGIPYMMAPPTFRHQDLAGEIYIQLKNFLKDKPCKVYISPIGVRLFPEIKGNDKTIVLPDIVVVCDEKKLSDGKTINGAPDFIIEIISPSSKGRDLIDKKELYEDAGVKEYWVVDADKVFKYVLLNKQYQETIFNITKGLVIKLSILKGCKISFNA